MAISGAAVGYSAIGGIILFSGIKGATLSATVKAVLAGNLNVSGTQTIGSASGASAGNVASGSASQNYITIANYLVSNGYSKAAAAGICSCIAGESSGNPESVQNPSNPGAGGEGLIQWTPGSTYNVPITGNATKDLQAQLPMILSYNNAQGAQLIGMLNQIADPVDAADFYSQYFERPQVTNSDVVTSVAQSVYAQLTNNTAAAAASTGTATYAPGVSTGKQTTNQKIAGSV
jgi:hypothetical protein